KARDKCATNPRGASGHHDGLHWAPPYSVCKSSRTLYHVAIVDRFFRIVLSAVETSRMIF
ncbi:MAG: hypothetical protein VB948_12820, partial [Pseudomonadales bacterium]